MQENQLHCHELTRTAESTDRILIEVTNSMLSHAIIPISSEPVIHSAVICNSFLCSGAKETASEVLEGRKLRVEYLK